MAKQKSSMSWCRSRSTRPIPTACRPAWMLAPGDVVCGAARPDERTGVVWGEGASATRPAQQAQGRHREARPAAAEGRSCAASSTGWPITRWRARHGAAHGAAHGRASRPGARAHRRAARGSAAAAHDRRARARADVSRRRHGAREKRSRARGRRVGRRDRRADRRGHAGNAGAAARAGGASARSGFFRAGAHAGASARPPTPCARRSRKAVSRRR